MGNERGIGLRGPVEVDGTYMGGKEKNKAKSQRKHAGGGPGGKTAAVGAKDRKTNQVTAQVIDRVNSETLNSFVDNQADTEAQVYTDGSTAYKSRENREAVRHSAGECVRYLEGAKIHANGIESFWSMLKRDHKGTFHRLSPKKHLQRYVNEFAGRHNARDPDTIDQMHSIVPGLVGKRLMYRDLIRPTARSAVAS